MFEDLGYAPKTREKQKKRTEKVHWTVERILNLFMEEEYISYYYICLDLDGESVVGTDIIL